MTKTVRARYTLEFKQEAVPLVTGGQSIATAARSLGVVEQTLLNWVRADRQSRLKGADSLRTARSLALSRWRSVDFGPSWRARHRYRCPAHGLVQTSSEQASRADLPQRQRQPVRQLVHQPVRQPGLQGRVDGIRLHGLDEPARQLLGQRLQRDAVRVVEGGAAARPTLRGAAPGKGRSCRLAALVQPDPTALDAGLRQPDAVRARLACGSSQKSQFVTRLWGTDSRGKVRTS